MKNIIMGRKVTKVKVFCYQRDGKDATRIGKGEYHALTGHEITFMESITYERVRVDAVNIIAYMGLTKVLVRYAVFVRHGWHVIEKKYLAGPRGGGRGELLGWRPPGEAAWQKL